MKTTMQRRSFIRGLGLGASAALLGPMWNQLEAHANGATPGKRLVIVVEGNGMREGALLPTMVVDAIKAAAGNRGNAGGRTYTFDDPLTVEQIDSVGAPILEALGEHIASALVVNGPSYHIVPGGHYSGFGLLTASGATGTPRSISVDHLIANELYTNKPFRHVAMGMVGTKGGSAPPSVKYVTTAPGPGKRGAVITNPNVARRALFGSVSGSAGMTEFDMRSNLLDFLTDDVAAFRNQLAGEERVKLEYYLHAVETLKNRQTKLEALQSALTAPLPPESDIYSSEYPIFRMEATFELASAALIAGLTDVVLLTSGTDNDFGVQFSSLGEGFPGKHALGHGKGYGEHSAAYWMGEITARHAAMIAGLADKLAAVPEGDGTMWDNTLVVFTNDAGNQHHNRNESWPALLLGGKNVPLHLAGRAVLYPTEGKAKHRHFSTLWNTVLHAMGVPRDDFGLDPAPEAAGTLDELMR